MELYAETVMTAKPFQELLDLTIETCLSDPERFDQHYHALKQEYRLSPEGQIVQRTGLWAVREVIENTKPQDFGRINYAEPEEGEELPPYMCPRPDIDVQFKIEALGKSILEEAFLCLGEEAEEKALEYRNAKDRESKLDIYEWVVMRIYKISHAKTTQQLEEAVENVEILPEGENQETYEVEEVEENDPRYFYHPIRISPKFIGRFPDIKADPTCLGVSILVASFWEKSETPYLHGGVMQTAAGTAQRALIRTFAATAKFAEAQGISFPEEVRAHYKKVIPSLREGIRYHQGFHACTISEQMEDEWVQTDPNYHSYITLSKHVSKRMREMYDMLKELEPTAKGIETLFLNRHVMVPHNFVHFGEELAKKPKTSEEIENYLLKAPEGTDAAAVSREFLKDFLDGSENESYASIKEQLEEMTDRAIPDGIYELYIHNSLNNAVLNRVFPDHREGDLSKSLARCRSDKRYLERRIEDLRMLPFYVLVALQTDFTNSLIEDKLHWSHTSQEIALPAYRIGAAVLSEFAIHCGDELPPSFWLAHWPSHISLAEHIDKSNMSPAQTELVTQTAEYIDARVWTYPGFDEMIKLVLEQERGDEPAAS